MVKDCPPVDLASREKLLSACCTLLRDTTLEGAPLLSSQASGLTPLLALSNPPLVSKLLLVVGAVSVGVDVAVYVIVAVRVAVASGVWVGVAVIVEVPNDVRVNVGVGVIVEVLTGVMVGVQVSVTLD